MPEMTITPVTTPLKSAFTIARGSKTSVETVVVELRQDGHRGRGEGVPYPRYGENTRSVMAQLYEVKSAIQSGLSRLELQNRLPAGAARCALDCALWDLEAKTRKQPVWRLAGLPEPQSLPTAMTLSLDKPEAMAAAARAMPGALLKLKLGRSDNFNRIRAVHKARPDARLVLDLNEGLDPADFPALAEQAACCGVFMIEQPFAACDEHLLASAPCPVTVCADESVHTCQDIGRIAGLYDAINIKLDKTGGLTEALALVKAAENNGLGIMIGCMVAGSLSMAPAVLLGRKADLIDLDGPLWLARDLAPSLHYDNGRVGPPAPALWG